MSYPEEFKDGIIQVLHHEGGYVNDPQDPGGETKFGISKRAYPNVDIKNLSRKQAIKIYYDDYWIKTGVVFLPKKLRQIYFDMTINMVDQEPLRFFRKLVIIKINNRLLLMENLVR